MAEIDTERLRKIQRVAADRIHPDCHTARERLTEQVPAIADELDRLQAENKQIGEERDSLASSLAIETGKYRDAWAENQRLTDLNRRAQAIIADAIMHGMPITEEVAAVRNGIVRGEDSLRALTKEAGE